MSETTSSRLLTLLSLLQGRRDWPGPELADRLEVSPRTIRRDVERLRSLGYPVESMTGPAGGYQLRAGTAMPPLLLDDDEAIAIAVGLRTAAGGQRRASRRPPCARWSSSSRSSPRTCAAASRRSSARPRRCRSTAAPTVDPQCLTMLAAAVRDHERVRFDYTARDKRGQQREAEPHSLVNAGRRWYLVACDCGREDWRTYRVDRIEQASRPPARASSPAAARPRTPPRSSSRSLQCYPRATRRG